MIQSISDIITNSSSEVFVISTDKGSEVQEFLKNVCELFGVDFNEVMSCEIASKDEYIYDLEAKENDLIVWSNGDNSIPSIIMDIISYLEWGTWLPAIKKLNVKEVNRRHLE